MSALLELAERCEQATKADRELSAAIALAVHDWLHEVEGNKPLNCRVRNSFGSPVYIGGASTAMDYTASLDAAMTLVPEGFEWCVAWGELPDRTWAGTASVQGINTKAATPAFALCAAALRARAAQ